MFQLEELLAEKNSTSAPFVYWDWYDIEEDKAFFSDELYQLLGYTQDELFSSYAAILQKIHPEDIARVEHVMDNHLLHDKPFLVDFRMQHKQGHYIWFRAQGKCIRNERKQPVRMLGTSICIQDLKEKKTEKTEKKVEVDDKREIILKGLDVILQTIPVGVFVLDLQSTVIRCNEILLELLGVEREDILNQHIENVTPAYAKKINRAVSFVVRHAKPRRNKEIDAYETPQGIRRNLSFGYFPIEYQGRVAGIVGVVEDITELKEKNKILESNNLLLAKKIGELERQNNRIKEFSQIITNNLQAPVAGLLGLAEFQSEASAEERETVQQLMQTNVFKLAELLDALTSVSRIHLLEELPVEKITLSLLVSQLLAKYQQELEAKGIELKLSISLDQVKSNKEFISLIIDNLLSNAIKFSQNDKGPFIRIVTYKVGNYWALEVQDNGKGIDLKRMKDKVFRLNKSFEESSKKGWGRGLFLVKHYTEALQGEVEVESEVGKGTNFRCKFLIEE